MTSSDEQQPGSDSERSEPGRTDASGVSDFLGALAKKKQPLLSTPLPEEHKLPAARRRSEFAKSMMESRQFTEAVQMMNEQVMEELVTTSPLETEKLAALCVRAQVISDFSSTLIAFVDEYETIRVIQEQHEKRENYG